MAASTREVFLLLRARDEASRVLRGFSSELTRSSAVLQAAAMRSRAVELQREVAARRQEAAVLAAAAADKLAAAAVQAKRIADARSIGTSDQRIYSMREVERRLKAEAAEINNKIRVMDKETSAMVAEIRMLDRQSSELERSHRMQRQLAQAISATSASVGTLGIALTTVGVAASYFFVQSFKSFQEYQRQVALTRTQIDGFTASFEQVSQVGLKIANEIPVAFQEIQPALFDIFSSTSANLKQSEMLLEGFARAAVAGQTDVQTAARGTIAILNGLNIPFENVNHILDVQFELVRKGVGTYEEFAKVFGRIIPAANRSQQSFETVAAMLAFMTRNGQSAAQASTAAARALELFTHPVAVRSLENMGVKVRDLKGNYLPLIDILKQLRAEMNKIPQADRVAAMVDAFKGSGFNIQARRFLEQVVLGANELENFEALLNSMGSAAGVMGEKYAEMADTAAAKTQLLSNRWEILKIAIGEAVAPVLLTIIDLFSRLLQWFNSLDPATKKMITNIAMIATGLALVGGAALIFLGTLAGVVAAVVAAGSVLAVVLGIVTALTIAFVALAGATALAWTKSEAFRNIVRDTVKDVKDLWSEVEKLGARIRDAFKSNSAAPLERLREIVETKVLPVLKDFRKEVVDIVLPKVVEAFRIIGDFAELTFKNVGKVVNDVVIPAVDKLSEWWAKNKDELMPFIDAAAQMIKWLLIIAGVVLGSGLLGGLGALITVIGLVTGAFMLAIESFKLTKAVIVDLIDFFVDASKETKDNVSATWNEFWSFLKGIFDSGVAYVKSVWDAWWGQMGGSVTAAFNLIMAIIDLGIAVALLPIEGAINALKLVWEAVWGAIGDTVKSVWEKITSTSESGRNKSSEIWNSFVDMVKDAWNRTVNNITEAVTKIIDTLAGWRQKIIDKVTEARAAILGFFDGLRTSMFEKGAEIIQGLIEGMTSKMEALTERIRSIAQRIKDFFPSSPAKTGPLSGMGSPYRSGQTISNMLASGMLYQTDAVRNATMQLASAASIPPPNFSGQSLLNPVGLGASTGSPLMPMRTSNVTVNVYTNEIDPRTTATELGWELEARL